MKANARICSHVNAPGEMESNSLMEELEHQSFACASINSKLLFMCPHLTIEMTFDYPCLLACTIYVCSDHDQMRVFGLLRLENMFKYIFFVKSLQLI